MFGADSDLGRNGVGALSYALLVFCLIYAYDARKGRPQLRGPCRRCNAGHRVGGARIVAAADSGVIVAFVVCGILAVANVLTGHHFGTSCSWWRRWVHLADVKPGASAAVSAEEHIIGVVVAAAVAVALHWAAVPLHDRVLKPLLPQ